MSIKLVITDPHTHGPIELRALAHYFNCLATDVAGGSAATVGIVAQQHTETSRVGNLETSATRTIYADGAQLDNLGLVKDPIDPQAHVVREMGNCPEENNPAEVFGGKSSEATGADTPASDAPTPDAALSADAASTVNPSQPAVPGVTVDKNNLPWDARIHASSKALNADGSWRAKRGIDQAIVPGVEAELRALMAIPVDAPAADDDAPPPIPDEDDDTPPPIPDETAGIPKTLGELMLLATAAVTAKRMEMTELTAAAKELGVAGLPLLGARPDLVAKVYEMLKGKLV